MADPQIHETIDELIAEEHRLREELSQHETSEASGMSRLHEIEVQLDQCWDLLRQRDAKRQYGRNPNEAHLRPADVVENYEG